VDIEMSRTRLIFLVAHVRLPVLLRRRSPPLWPTPANLPSKLIDKAEGATPFRNDHSGVLSRM